MIRGRTTLILVGAAAAGIAISRHLRGPGRGRSTPGGILIGDAAGYDTASRLVLGSFYAGIAADVASVATDGARVLEVGCGPGHLSIRLARAHGLDVTGMDLDPAMIARARANAERAHDGGPRPAFSVGDVGSLSFPDGSFDLVVSTLSMHHWADPRAGLAEIGRVLTPDGRGLIWDLRPGKVPFHAHVPDPVEQVRGSDLEVLRVTAWRWPLGLPLTRRVELARR